MDRRPPEQTRRQATAAAKLASYKAEQVRLKEVAAARRAAAAERAKAEQPTSDR